MYMRSYAETEEHMLRSAGDVYFWGVKGVATIVPVCFVESVNRYSN